MSKSPSDYYEMTSRRKKFLNSLKKTFNTLIGKRYAAGQKEHGGDLWLKATYPMLGSELIDAYTYYQTHQVRMTHWLYLLSNTYPIIDAEREADVSVVVQELIAELGVETSTEVLARPKGGLDAFDQ